MPDQDILIGPGKLYRAPLGEANPDKNTVEFDQAWGGNWEDMGDFIEGSPISIGMPETFTEVYTERSTAPVNAARTRREQTIKCTLAEHSVANMETSLQGTATTTAASATAKAVSEIPYGSQSEVEFYKWGVEATRKDATGVQQPVRWFFHKGYLKLAGETAYAKQNPTGIPIEIKILADRTQPAGQDMGKLQIVTGGVTA